MKKMKKLKPGVCFFHLLKTDSPHRHKVCLALALSVLSLCAQSCAAPSVKTLPVVTASRPTC
jgi:hypothetical protein